VLDCYDVSVQPQTRPRSSLTFVRRYTPFVAYTPKPHGHNLCATISLLVLSYCLYVFCVDCSYLWATGHASYCSDHVYRCDERGGERSSRFYHPLTRCARYANYVYISWFYRPLTRCTSLTWRGEAHRDLDTGNEDHSRSHGPYDLPLTTRVHQVYLGRLPHDGLQSNSYAHGQASQAIGFNVT